MGGAYPRDTLEHAPSALVNVSEFGHHLSHRRSAYIFARQSSSF